MGNYMYSNYEIQSGRFQIKFSQNVPNASGHEFTVCPSRVNSILGIPTCDLVFHSPNLATLTFYNQVNFCIGSTFLRSSAYINQFHSQRKIVEVAFSEVF